MTTTQTPDEWAIAKVRGMPADIFFSKLDEQLDQAKRAYKAMHQTYQMTHNPGFRDLARGYAYRIRGFNKIIQENVNLYSIINGLSPDTGWIKGLGLN